MPCWFSLGLLRLAASAGIAALLSLLLAFAHRLRRAATPNVLWAQRKEFLLLKIDLPDVKNEKITVDGSKVHFEGDSQGKLFVTDLELFADVVKEVRFAGGRCAAVERALISPSGQQVDCSSSPD